MGGENYVIIILDPMRKSCCSVSSCLAYALECSHFRDFSPHSSLSSDHAYPDNFQKIHHHYCKKKILQNWIVFSLKLVTKPDSVAAATSVSSTNVSNDTEHFFN